MSATRADGLSWAFCLAVIPRSPESKFDSDIREINESGIERVLQDVETAYLSDLFWDSGLTLDNRRE